VDFECRRQKLIIEVDGNQHGFEKNKMKDIHRDGELAKRGYRVLRFSNTEVDREIEGVLEAIRISLEKPHPAATRPPSPKGEG
jgi:very-short-patch-repair endonuclease